MWVKEGTLTMSFVLYTIHVKCMRDASYVTWNYRQYRWYHVIFARKYKTWKNVNILEARFNSSGTPFFVKMSDWFSLYLCCIISTQKYDVTMKDSIVESRIWKEKHFCNKNISRQLTPTDYPPSPCWLLSQRW